MVGKPCLGVVAENPNQLKLNLKCPYWSYEVRLVCRSCLSQHICTVKCAHNENQQTKPEAQTSKLCSRKTHSIKIFLWRGICEDNGKQGKGLSRWLSDAVGLSCPVRSTFVLVHIFCFCSYFCSYFVHIFCSYFLFLLIFSYFEQWSNSLQAFSGAMLTRSLLQEPHRATCLCLLVSQHSDDQLWLDWGWGLLWQSTLTLSCSCLHSAIS